MSGMNGGYRIKRSCLHNLRVTSSVTFSDAEIPEGLVLPEEVMALCDIVPYEQIIVTKIGGNNWVNRMHSFAIPGISDVVEARGAVAHLLGKGDLCCVISGTYLSKEQHQKHLQDTYEVPIVDVRLYPEDAKTNNLSKVKIVLEYSGKIEQVPFLKGDVVNTRKDLPRVMLSNLLTGLKVEAVERRGCIEMSAELPVAYMERAGFCKNQSVLFYNTSRGGASAESYVVPSLTKKTVGISGALSAVADLGDIISEAAYVITTEKHSPIICDVRPGMTAGSTARH
jgi:aspartate 1-decarboxylase